MPDTVKMTPEATRRMLERHYQSADKIPRKLRNLLEEWERRGADPSMTDAEARDLAARLEETFGGWLRENPKVIWNAKP